MTLVKQDHTVWGRRAEKRPQLFRADCLAPRMAYRLEEDQRSAILNPIGERGDIHRATYEWRRYNFVSKGLGNRCNERNMVRSSADCLR